jgi:hypothetical protein
MKRVEFNYRELCKATQRFLNIKEDDESPVSAVAIYRYLSATQELGGLSLIVSRSTVMRVIRKLKENGDTTISFPVKEQGDLLSDKQKVELVQEILKSKRISNGDWIDRVTFNEIMNYSHMSAYQLASYLRVTSTEALMTGRYENVLVYPSGKFESKDIYERSRMLREHLKKQKTKKTFTWEDVQKMATSFNITERDIVINILCKNKATYTRLKAGKIRSIEMGEIYEDYGDPEEIPYQSVMGKSDKDEGLNIPFEYILNSLSGIENRDELEATIMSLRDENLSYRERLSQKYSSKLDILVRRYKSDGIIHSESFNKKYKVNKEYFDAYLYDLFEVLSHNPDYEKGIKIDELKKILEDFDCDIYYFMRSIMERYYNLNREFMIIPRKINENYQLPKPFQDAYGEELYKICERVSKNLVRTSCLNSKSIADIASKLYIAVAQHGGKILFNTQYSNMEEVFCMLGGYAKKVGEQEINNECKAFQQLTFDRNSNDKERVPEDHDPRRGDYRHNIEEEAIDNLERTTGAKRARGQTRSKVSIPPIDTMDDEMLRLLTDDEHVELLENFAKQLGMNVEQIREYVQERIT